MELLTVRNRYPAQPFVGRYDGQEYVVKDTLTVPDNVARHLQGQSVVRDNPITGEREYRLAIVETDGPMDNLESLPIETLDRTDFDVFRKVQIVDLKANKPVPPAPRGSGRDVAIVTKN